VEGDIAASGNALEQVTSEVAPARRGSLVAARSSQEEEGVCEPFLPKSAAPAPAIVTAKK